MFSKSALIHLLLLVPLAIAVPAPAKSESVATSEPKESEIDSTSIATEASSKSSSSGGKSKIDFTHWDLQLPVGQPNKPETIDGSKLKSYSDPKKEYFYTTGDGVVVMRVPGSPAKTGCVHTPNSKHCRTELVERNPSSWNPKAATNRLSATLVVIKADDSKTGTCVGQIHIEDSVSSKPVAELYYNSEGKLTFGVEQTRAGGNEKLIPVTTIPLGTKFSYTIAYEKDELSVTINGGKKQVFSTYSLNAPMSYFKAGNYNQGNSESEVHFYDIALQH
jgi:hypothetical protein